MAIKYTPIYTNEYDYISNLARSSDLYREDAFNALSLNNQEEDYAYAVAGTATKNSDTFDLVEYNLLSGEDQYMYLVNEYYVDKTATEKDKETGETYSIYARNREYLDYKIQEAIDLKNFESLSGFEKFLHTTIGVLGNALNELFLGTIEGLVDLGAVIVGQKDWAATDFTGVQANREALQKYARAYTYIDKSAVAGTINNVVTGLAKLVVMKIPYVGPFLYFAAGAGNTAEAAIRANPDIDYGTLLAYTALSTGLEFATEKISGKLLGTGKLVGGAKAGNFLTRFALDFATEGFEEAVAEIGGSLLYTAMVDSNAPIASFSDVMYAGLIGGLIGGIATTGRVAGTRSQTILKDGSVIDTKLAKLTNQEGTKLSKTKSLFLQESISEAKRMLSENAVTDLQAKYSSETLEQIKTNHADEYNNAVQKQQKQQNKFIKSAMGLSKILDIIGPEGFQKATNLLEYSMDQQARLISNFVAKTTSTSAKNRAVEEKFQRLAGGKSSFTISDTLNSTQQKIKDGIKKLYGKDVYFGNIGEQDGVMKRHGLTLDENTIVLDVNLTQNESIDTIMNKVVKEELVHSLQFQSGILDAKTLHDLMEQYKKLGGEITTTELDASYAASSDISKISEAQAKALSQTLLFDNFTVARIFNTNRTLFNKVYNWLRNLKENIERLKERKTNKDKITYKQLLKCMKTYKDSVAEQIGNEQDANTAKAEMNLSDEELLTLLATYIPDNTNEHYTLLSAEYTIHTQQRMAAEKLLSRARADINKTLPFSYRHVFDPTYYGTIKASDGTEINFVEQIMARNPEQDFRYNLQEYMINECGFAINEKEGCLMEVVDYNKVTTQEFDTTCAELQTNPIALNKYTNLSQIFDQKFNEKFVDEDGRNQLEEIDLKIVARDGDAPLQAHYGLNLDTNKPTITVYIKEGQTMSLSQINNLKHKIFHETTHALADIQGLQNGTSTTYVRSALMESADRKTINKLAKLLLTDEFYAENKNNTQILIDNIAYGIYRITDGEYAAEAYASSFARKGDMKVNLKAGATMNRSGFRTDGLYIYGYGRFSGIELQATTIVRAKQQYKASALRKATEVVAFAKESGLNNFLAGKGVVDLEKAGFSYEMRDALENETLTEQDLLDLFNRNEIGSPEATNIIIEWLTRNKPNKNVKTIEDINKIKRDGLINAMTYNKIRQKNDPQYNKNEPHSYEEVKSFIDKNPNAQITEKTKDGTREISAVMYKYKKLDKIEDYLTVENSKANQIILQSDFDYSINSTKQLLKDLRNNKISQEFMEIDTEESPDMSDDDSRVSSAIDKISYEQYEDVVDTGEMDGIVEKESIENKLLRISNDAKKNLSEWLTTSGRSGKAYEIKETLLEYARNIKETETDLSFNSIVSKEDFEDIISSVITEENWQNIHTKIRNNKAFIDALFGDGTSLDLRTQIKNEFSKVQETKAEKLKDIAKGVSKESNIKPKAVEQKPIVEIAPTPVETSVSVEQTPDVEVEREKTEKTAKEIVLVLDSLPAEILTLLKDSNTDESRAQLFEGADTEYTTVSSKIVHDNMELFMRINDANYEQTRIGLSSSPQALTLFDYYTVEYLGTFSKETQQKILNNTRRAQTAAAQRQALQSKRVKDRKPVSDLKHTFEREGYEIVLTEDDVVEILGEDAIVDKDAEINRLKDEIEKLRQSIVIDMNEGRQMAQQEDERQLKKLAAKKAALESGDLFEILDALISEMGLEQATKTMESVLRKVVKTMKISDKEVGIYMYDKKGNLKAFPKLRKSTAKLFLGLKKFRMWAMLSSPVSWVRNWVGNKGMQALDGVTNTVERFLTKNTSLGRSISGDSLKYNETKGGKELSDYIDEKYGGYILNSVIRKEDSRWDVTGQKTQALEYAKREEKARTGNVFVKAINKAVNWEQWGLERGFLGDEPILIRSICKNTANLIASNVDWCLKGIQNEYDALQEIVKSGRALSTQEQETRMKVMEKALETKNLKDILDALSDDAISYLVGNAGQRSFEQYFKNSNMFSEWIYKLGQKSPILGEMMSWVMPFPKVAANILTMAYRYSPLGFIRAFTQMSIFKQQSNADYKGRIDEFAGAKTIRSFSEATVGTFMWIVGMIAGALGWIEMDDDDYMGPSITIGDFKMSLSDLAPSLTVLSVGAAMMQGWKNGEVGLKRALNVLYDNTLLGNFDNLFNYSSSESFLQNLGITYMGQYIPAFVKLLAKTSDPRKMDKSGANYWEKLWNTFKSYIPGLSYTVPSKVNPYTGEDVYRSGTNAWWFNILNAISPLEMTYTPKSEEQKLAESLGAGTTGLTGRFTINDKSYNVTGAKKEQLAKYRADYIQQRYSKISSGQEKVTVENDKGVRITTTWNKLTNAQKKTVMERIYSDASNKAKIKYWLDSGNIYRTSNQNEFAELKKLFKSGIEFRSGWSKSKFIER